VLQSSALLHVLMNGSDQVDSVANCAQPLVSVVIPAYNCAQYISETLESILAQSFADYEIILVNDGSPDTQDLERVLMPYMNGIRYLKQENSGPSAARNRGITEARGKYVAFLDSDDRWLPEHLERQMRLLEDDARLGLVYADGIVTIGGAPVRTCFQINRQTRPVTFEVLVQEDSTVVTSTTVARRDALLEAGLFDNRFRHGEDFDLWARVLLCGFRIDYNRQIQVVRRSGIGLSADSESMKRSLFAIYRKMSSELPLSAAQKHLVLRQQARAEADLQLWVCKKALASGQTLQALQAAQSACRVLPNWRLRGAILGLRFVPRLLVKVYPVYANALARRGRARLTKLKNSFERRLRQQYGGSIPVRPKTSDASNSPEMPIHLRAQSQ